VRTSPDGSLVAWSVETLNDIGEATGKSQIYTAPSTPGGPIRRITAGSADKDYEEREPAWSSDGKRLAFLSDAASERQRQLYVVDPKSGTPRKLTALTGYFAEPQWAPDGQRIAVLFTENAPRASGPLEPMTPDTGVVEEHVYEQRIAVVDTTTGATRVVSPADMYVYHYDWSPDGKRIAAVAAPGSGDNNWWIAQLHVLDLGSGAFPSIYKPPQQIADPHFSPDGRWVAVIGGIMSDEGSTGGDVYIVSADGGAVRNLTPGMKASATSLDWPQPDRIRFVENIDGDAGLATISVGQDPRIEQVWHAPQTVTTGDAMSLSFSKGGEKSAAILSSFTRPPEVVAGRVGAWSTISSVNGSAHAGWSDAVKVHWTSDAAQVQGWILAPATTARAREGRSPMIVWVHGGPASASLARWPRAEVAALVGRGYYVFYPNPRGSYGQGEAFTAGNVKDFGYGDLRDILTGVDAVIRDYRVDGKRLGMWGWSYGGYMAMWTVTQTNRFAAVVAGAGLSNWQSYYGQNDIDQWMIPYFGASVYDDPAVYARSAPMTYIKNAKTPMLLLVGERDGEVPAPQSYEFWHALKTLGVETRLVVYPGEGHRIRKTAHRRDIVERSVDWFDAHMH
jgi:dipeptidyl aminopeptidase/acylaminoacyl peptidase